MTTASNLGLQNEYGVDDEFMFMRLPERDAPEGIVNYAPDFSMFSV
ncbi:MAG TPA: hypothetical protein VGA72_00800 [Anaerolineales bacterium]